MHQPVSYIQQTKDLYDSLGYEAYRWFRADSPTVFVKPPLPLSRSKLGLVSTAGTYLAGQIAYHYKDDTSIRAIPSDSEVADIRFSHVTENYLIEARQDPRCVFPIEALRSLRDMGAIGRLADNFFSCMGGIYSQRRVTEKLIPELAARIEQEDIDVLLLVPL